MSTGVRWEEIGIIWKEGIQVGKKKNPNKHINFINYANMPIRITRGSGWSAI